VPPAFGSRSTHLPSGVGGLAGRALAAGDRLSFGTAGAAGIATVRRASPKRGPVLEMPSGHARLRFIPAAQLAAFAPDAIVRVQSGRYTVRADSNRMGYRLEGPAIRTPIAGDLLSQPSPIGSLQVPHDGQPILLMADRQTTGGYPLLGTVITADLGLAGQLGPADTVAFAACTRQEALAALIAQERVLMAMR
jgi:allophanate hydrolase subunit 2